MLRIIVSGAFFTATATALVTAKNQDDDLVTVSLYGEASCPFTRDFILGTLNETTEDMGHILNFDFVPFGNSYFVTETCGGAEEYDLKSRQCYFKTCGAQVPASKRPADCFSGDVVCQHGESECKANRYIACAKTLGTGTFHSYMPYVTCLENGLEIDQDLRDDQDVAALAEGCAGQLGFRVSELQACFEGPAGDEAIKKAAMATPDHPGVPWVMVNGVALPEDGEDGTPRAVCDAYKGKGPTPIGCRNGRWMLLSRRACRRAKQHGRLCV